MAMRIVFNGREYAGSDQMPSDVRRLYDLAMDQLADADRDGVPDVLGRGGAAGHVIGIEHTSITVNGATYGSVDEMPADVRRLCEQAMASIGANPGGVPGVFQGDGGGGGKPAEGTVQRDLPWTAQFRRPSRGAVETVPRRGWLLLAAAVGILLLVWLL
jgi:hypothetical protein